MASPSYAKTAIRSLFTPRRSKRQTETVTVDVEKLIPEKPKAKTSKKATKLKKGKQIEIVESQADTGEIMTLTTNGDQTDEDVPVPCTSSNCRQMLGSDSECLQCDWCDLWFCLPCAEMTQPAYQNLQSNEVLRTSMMWFCRGCQRAVPKVKNLLKTVTTHDERITKMEKVVSKIQEEMEDVVHTEQLIDDFEKYDEHVSTKIQEAIDGQQKMKDEEDTCKIMREIEEREHRKYQLIIRNVPESIATTVKERISDDIALVCNVYNDTLGLSVSVTHASRLGRPRNPADSAGTTPAPRPLQIRFAEKKMVPLVLNKNDEIYRNTQSKNWYQKRDRTVMERNELTALYKLRDQKQQETLDAGDTSTKWVVRSFKVMKQTGK